MKKNIISEGSEMLAQAAWQTVKPLHLGLLRKQSKHTPKSKRNPLQVTLLEDLLRPLPASSSLRSSSPKTNYLPQRWPRLPGTSASGVHINTRSPGVKSEAFLRAACTAALWSVQPCRCPAPDFLFSLLPLKPCPSFPPGAVPALLTGYRPPSRGTCAVTKPS